MQKLIRSTTHNGKNNFCYRFPAASETNANNAVFPAKGSRQYYINMLFLHVPEILAISVNENYDEDKAHFVITGGKDNDIAAAIHEILPIIIGTEGNIAIEIKNEYTETIIRFSRPNTKNQGKLEKL